MEGMKTRFQKVKKIGEGSYGSVNQVFDRHKKAMRALKKIKFLPDDEGIPVNALREITSLKKVDNHPNIVKLYEVFYFWEQAKLYLVLEYVEANLFQFCKKNFPLSPYAIKSIMHQLLSALYHLNTLGIMHRDIKPQNILINGQGQIKLCDFGQSKLISINEVQHTCQVATLWYRSPQLLLGSSEVYFNIDIWSVGCIFCEMVLGKPLFKSDCEIGQIMKIFQIFGTPSVEEFPKWAFLNQSLPQFKKQELELSRLNEQGNKLMRRMLQLNPKKRVGAYEALRDKYFDGL